MHLFLCYVFTFACAIENKARKMEMIKLKVKNNVCLKLCRQFH